jgi:hypothetical protein
MFVVLPYVARMVGEGRCLERLVKKPEGKRPLGRPRLKWEDIKMNLQEVGWGHGLDLSGSG